jgi:signal transduction histidine kinase
MTTLPVDMTTHSEPRGRYLARWRTVPRELGFLLAGLPVALLAFVVTITMFSFAAGTLVVVGGFFVLAATMLVSRWFGRVELARLEAAGMPRIDRPDWDTPHRPGPVGWLRHYLANAHFWLYLLHAGVVNFVVSLFSWIVAVTWTVTGLGCLSYGIWGRFAERDDQNVWLGKIIIEFVLPSVDMGREHSALFATEVVLYLILGVVFIATLPFITRALVRLHHAVAKGMLGRFASDDLKREVQALGESRDAAVVAEDHSLRRLERDIHDGPQQRLVRLQFDLASAERALDSDPDAARALLEGARQQSRDTLEELRELSRGFAPPLLQDRGLRSALESLAARSTVPTSIRIDLGTGDPVAPEIERSAYFIAAELLANVSKHSGAKSATLSAAVQPDASGERMLALTVFDDGVGGATVAAGHGLDGLHERLRGLRGELSITSPAGGPTMVAARIPLS